MLSSVVIVEVVLCVLTKDFVVKMSGLSFLRRMSFQKGKSSKHSSQTSVAAVSPDVIVPPLEDLKLQEAEVAEVLVVPDTQRVLLLHAAKQPYELTHGYPVPEVEGDHEVLVKSEAIGLNPIDWKAPYVSILPLLAID